MHCGPLSIIESMRARLLLKSAAALALPKDSPKTSCKVFVYVGSYLFGGGLGGGEDIFLRTVKAVCAYGDDMIFLRKQRYYLAELLPAHHAARDKHDLFLALCSEFLRIP